jgi:hypothetical protein
MAVRVRDIDVMHTKATSPRVGLVLLLTVVVVAALPPGAVADTIISQERAPSKVSA